MYIEEIVVFSYVLKLKASSQLISTILINFKH